VPIYLDPITHPDAWNTVVFGKLPTPGKCKVSGWARKNDYDIKVGKGTAGATETLKGQPPAEGTFEFWAWTPQHFAAWNAIESVLAYKPGKGASQTSAAPTTGSSAASQGAGYSIGATKNDNGGGTASAAIPEPGNTTGKPKEDSGDTKDKSPPALSKDDAIAVYYPSLAGIGVTAIIPPAELGAWEEDGDASGYWKRTIKATEFVQAGTQNVATTPTGAGAGTVPGETTAGGTEGTAPPNAAGQAKGAGGDAQGAWGAAA